MGFAGSSCSFTRFKILDPVENDLVLQIPDLLKKNAIQDIDALPEMRAFGWVCYEDMLDTAWIAAPPQKAQYLIFSLRLDTRRIPPAVISKYTNLAIKKEKAENGEFGQKFISRERKKELKEQVILKLRDRFLPVPAEFNVLWNLDANEVWFASTQTKMIDLFMEFFLNSFNLHLEPLTPYALAQTLIPESALDGLDKIQSTQFMLKAGAE